MIHSLLLAFALAFAGNDRHANADIDAIVLRGLPCHACSQGVSINASGLISPLSSSAGDPAEPLTPEDRTKVRALIAQLPLDEMRKARDTAPLPANTTGLVFVEIIYHDGTRENAAVPQSFPRRTTQGLGEWIGSVTSLSDAVLFRSRVERLQTALQSNTLRSIELQTLPSYGPAGRGYTAVFTNADVATIAGACEAKSRVPFARVLAASVNLPWLLPQYSTNTIDASGARISVELLDGSSFSSEGYASNDWDQFFLIMETRLDQIVRDAVWTPTLDSPACRRMLGLR